MNRSIYAAEWKEREARSKTVGSIVANISGKRLEIRALEEEVNLLADGEKIYGERINPGKGRGRNRLNVIDDVVDGILRGGYALPALTSLLVGFGYIPERMRVIKREEIKGPSQYRPKYVGEEAAD